MMSNERRTFREWLELSEEKECPYCFYGYKIPVGLMLREENGRVPKPSDYPCDVCNGTNRFTGPEPPGARMMRQQKMHFIVDMNKTRADAEKRFRRIREEMPDPDNMPIPRPSFHF